MYIELHLFQVSSAQEKQPKVGLNKSKTQLSGMKSCEPSLIAFSRWPISGDSESYEITEQNGKL